IQGNVEDYDCHTKCVKKTIEKFEKLDIFVYNSGVYDGFAILEKLPVNTIDEAISMIFDTNVTDGLIDVKAAYTDLKKIKRNINFTTSNAAFYPNGGGPIYTASKHAIIGLVRELAFELAPNIRVNAVSPGGTTTNISAIPPLQDVVNQVD